MATKSKAAVGKQANPAGTRKRFGSEQFRELVVYDEPRLHACLEWLRGAQHSIQWLNEAVLKCMEADKLGTWKQASALAELRDAARILSDHLCECESHVNVVAEPFPTRIREEIYALQGPLIAMQADDWKRTTEESLDRLLAALAGYKRESAHVAEFVVTALECFRREAAKGKRSSKVNRPGRKPDHARKEELRKAVDEDGVNQIEAGELLGYVSDSAISKASR